MSRAVPAGGATTHFNYATASSITSNVAIVAELGLGNVAIDPMEAIFTNPLMFVVLCGMMVGAVIMGRVGRD